MKPTDRITPEGAEALYEIAEELEYLALEIKGKGTQGRMVGDVAGAPKSLSEIYARLSRLVDCEGKSFVYPPTALPVSE